MSVYWTVDRSLSDTICIASIGKSFIAFTIELLRSIGSFASVTLDSNSRKLVTFRKDLNFQKDHSKFGVQLIFLFYLP